MAADLPLSVSSRALTLLNIARISQQKAAQNIFGIAEYEDQASQSKAAIVNEALRSKLLRGHLRCVALFSSSSRARKDLHKSSHKSRKQSKLATGYETLRSS